MGISMRITQNVCRWVTATITPVAPFALLAFTTLTTVAFAQSVTIPAPVEKAAQAQITRDTLEAPIRFLADDLLEGRGPATRGDQLARLYLSRELQAIGFQPGAPN